MIRSARFLAGALALAGLLGTPGKAVSGDAANGNVLYRAYCTQCHGVEGDGWGVNAAYMAVQPRDHTEKKEMLARTDDDLFKVIKFGGKAINKSILMPSWGANLPDNEIRDVIAYLRTLTATE